MPVATGLSEANPVVSTSQGKSTFSKDCNIYQIHKIKTQILQLLVVMLTIKIVDSTPVLYH